MAFNLEEAVVEAVLTIINRVVLAIFNIISDFVVGGVISTLLFPAPPTKVGGLSGLYWKMAGAATLLGSVSIIVYLGVFMYEPDHEDADIERFLKRLLVVFIAILIGPQLFDMAVLLHNAIGRFIFPDPFIIKVATLKDSLGAIVVAGLANQILLGIAGLVTLAAVGGLLATLAIRQLFIALVFIMHPVLMVLWLVRIGPTEYASNFAQSFYKAFVIVLLIGWVVSGILATGGAVAAFTPGGATGSTGGSSHPGCHGCDVTTAGSFASAEDGSKAGFITKVMFFVGSMIMAVTAITKGFEMAVSSIGVGSPSSQQTERRGRWQALGRGTDTATGAAKGAAAGGPTGAAAGAAGAAVDEAPEPTDAGGLSVTEQVGSFMDDTILNVTDEDGAVSTGEWTAGTAGQTSERVMDMAAEKAPDLGPEDEEEWLAANHPEQLERIDEKTDDGEREYMGSSREELIEDRYQRAKKDRVYEAQPKGQRAYPAVESGRQEGLGNKGISPAVRAKEAGKAGVERGQAGVRRAKEIASHPGVQSTYRAAKRVAGDASKGTGAMLRNPHMSLVETAGRGHTYYQENPLYTPQDDDGPEDPPTGEPASGPDEGEPPEPPAGEPEDYEPGVTPLSEVEKGDLTDIEGTVVEAEHFENVSNVTIQDDSGEEMNVAMFEENAGTEVEPGDRLRAEQVAIGEDDTPFTPEGTIEAKAGSDCHLEIRQPGQPSEDRD